LNIFVSLVMPHFVNGARDTNPNWRQSRASASRMS
jgi:hypothetical protein